MNKLPKDTLCRRNAHCRLEDAVAVDTVEHGKAGNEARERRLYTGTEDRETQTI